MLNPRFNEPGPRPLQRLDQLLAETAPWAEPIFMSLGEPQLSYPDFVAGTPYENRHLYGKNPPPGGTAEFRQAAADWLARRFKLPPEPIDEARHIVALVQDAAATERVLNALAETLVEQPAPGNL